MGDPTRECAVELTGDELAGEADKGDPAGELNSEEAREPLSELRKGFPEDKRITGGVAGEPLTTGDDVVRVAVGLVMVTFDETGDCTGELVDVLGNGTPSENEGSTCTFNLRGGKRGSSASSSSLLLPLLPRLSPM